MRQLIENYKKGQAFPPPLVSPGVGSVQSLMEGFDKRTYELVRESDCPAEYAVDDRYVHRIQDVPKLVTYTKTWQGKGVISRNSSWNNLKPSGCVARMWLDMGKGAYTILTDRGLFNSTEVPVRYTDAEGAKDVLVGFGVNHPGVLDAKLPTSGMVLEGSLTILAAAPPARTQAPGGLYINEAYMPDPAPMVSKPGKLTVRWRAEPIEMEQRRAAPVVAATAEPEFDPTWPPPLFTPAGQTAAPASEALIKEMDRYYEAEPGSPMAKAFLCMLTGMEGIRSQLSKPASAHLKTVEGARTVSCALHAWCERRTKHDLTSLSEMFITRYLAAPSECSKNEAYRNPDNVVAANGALFEEVSGVMDQ